MITQNMTLLSHAPCDYVAMYLYRVCIQGIIILFYSSLLVYNHVIYYYFPSICTLVTYCLHSMNVLPYSVHVCTNIISRAEFVCVCMCACVCACMRVCMYVCVCALVRLCACMHACDSGIYVAIGLRSYSGPTGTPHESCEATTYGRHDIHMPRTMYNHVVDTCKDTLHNRALVIFYMPAWEQAWYAWL